VICVSASRRTIEIGACLLALTLTNQAQNARPDFTGVWRQVSTTRGPLIHSVMEIKQRESTLLLRPVLSEQSWMKWEVYSTDGTVMTTKIGRQVIERNGHWDGNQLVLQVTGPGNAPWRRSTEQRVLSLSQDRSRMIVKIHYLGDKRSVHDYAIESERVKQ
jgi:hypothetical protein